MTESGGSANGFYEFTGLEVALAGDPIKTRYLVVVERTTRTWAADNPVPPTEYNPPLGQRQPRRPTNDFLFEEPDASPGDRVWYDQDQDGIQDVTKPGVNGVDVALYDNATCTATANTTTANGGTRPRRLVRARRYGDRQLLLGFSDIPSGWTISPQEVVAGTEATDSDPDADHSPDSEHQPGGG